MAVFGTPNDIIPHRHKAQPVQKQQASSTQECIENPPSFPHGARQLAKVGVHSRHVLSLTEGDSEAEYPAVLTQHYHVAITLTGGLPRTHRQHSTQVLFLSSTVVACARLHQFLHGVKRMKPGAECYVIWEFQLVTASKFIKSEELLSERHESYLVKLSPYSFRLPLFIYLFLSFISK